MADKRKELETHAPVQEQPAALPEQVSQIHPATPIDMDFLTLVNKRLDHVKAYNSDRHYKDYIYLARRWVKHWRGKTCGEVDAESIRNYLLKRLKQTSAFTANKELRYLRATFNFVGPEKARIQSVGINNDVL